MVCSRSRQNEYFIGSRQLELAELKLIVDAVQAAKFISPKKSRQLIDKVSALASSHQAQELKRNLYVNGKVKTNNEKVYYTVDMLHTAIQTHKTVTFKYVEYTADKKKVYKHKGQIYILSPYDMVWSNDAYYVFGFSESHDKVVKFRVDRIDKAEPAEYPYRPQPDSYHIVDYCRQVFSMYDGILCTVELRCENELMNAVVDRFGEDVQTRKADCAHFIAVVEVSVSPTFFAWVFTYGDQIEILSPQEVRQEYRNRLEAVLNQENG